MTKVNNRGAIRRLAIRELKADRRMNMVVILSIVLTCVLFTTLTSIGGGLINGTQQETMRQVGGDRMAGLKYVLPEDYEKVKADGQTRDVVYRILVGEAVNEAFRNINVEMDCAGDGHAAKAMFCDPTIGKLPERDDEIAVSTLVLDELGLPYELGITVPITLASDGEISEHEFTLCGYWTGEKIAMAQVCWVSRGFADKYAPTPAESYYTQDSPKYAGYWNVDFNYANSWDIEGKTKKLVERLYGDSDSPPQTGVNWAYMTSKVDGGTLVGGIAILFVIFAAGYLIIYHIFYINISANIRGYGLLKTIGTTSRQIQRMVKVKAAVYCGAGIPLGLLVGVLIGKVLMKSIIRILTVYSEASYAISAGLLGRTCVVSALFTFATVMISCRKPCRIAGSVSPIEALRYNDTNTGTRKKTAVVVLSLTLSMLLVNTLFTVLGSIDEDKFIGNVIVGDIMIRSADEMTGSWLDSVKGITADSLSDLEQIGGAKVHPVYVESGSILPSGEPLERLKRLHEKYKENKEQEAELEAAVKGGYYADIYGIDEAVAAYAEPIEGSIDPEKLKTGRYAMVHTYLFDADDDSEVDIYHVGDKITVECGEKKSEYEVMAVCSMPYPLSTKVYHSFQTQVILSSDAYMALTDEAGAVSVMIDTDEDSSLVKERVKAYCDRGDSSLHYSDKQTYLDEFHAFIRMVKLVGGTLSGILVLIGVLNFANAVVTGIISRKREFAMMNAVGMTGRQLKAMLMREGVRYAVLTTVCSLILAVLLDDVVVKNIAGELFFFTFHFTLLPILVCAVMLLFLSMLIPVVSYRMICRDSIVDRIRENG